VATIHSVESKGMGQIWINLNYIEYVGGTTPVNFEKLIMYWLLVSDWDHLYSSTTW